jgi:biopolymer transport protein ExbB/TolQ
MNDLLELAQARPYNAAFNWSFWKKQPQAFLYLGICIFMFYILIPYTFPHEMDEIAKIFNIFVTALLLFGLWQVAVSIAKIEIELAYAKYVRNVADTTLIEVKGGNRIIEVSELRNLLPENNKSIMSRLFSHIISEAEARKFESNLVTIQPYKEEILTSLLKIGEIQKVSLHIGILGTFIGLMGAFSFIGNDKDVDTIFGNLTKSLTFAFGTSIGGIRNSIILSILSRMLQKKQELLFENLENATDSILALGRWALNRDDIGGEFDQVRVSVHNLSDKVEFQNQIVNRQTQDIQSGIDRLGLAKDKLDEFLKEISLKESVFLNEIQYIYDKISPESISQQLHTNLETVVKEITVSLQSNLKDTLEQYKELNTSIGIMYDYLKRFDGELRSQIQLSTDNVTKSKEEVFTSLSEMAKMQEKFVQSISNMHIAEELKQSVISASEQITKRYHSELHSMLPHVEKVGQELKAYNDFTREEMEIRTPPRIVLEILTLFT